MQSGWSERAKHVLQQYAELEKQPWYHGYRPIREIVPLLKEPGDFLMREKDRNRLFMLSVLDDEKNIRKFTISPDLPFLQYWRTDKCWQSKCRSIFEFVELHRKRLLPGNILLVRGIPRETWNINKKQIIFDTAKDLLGNGTFSKVYKALYNRTNEETITVAVKIFDVKDQSSVAIEDRKTVLRDKEMFRFCRKEKVSQLFGVVSDVLPTMIVMEYCIGGTLESHLKKSGKDIVIGERIVYCFEATLGLMFVHSKILTHGDVAARNYLIASDGRIKISDYGLSSLIKADIIKKDLEKAPKIDSGIGKALRWTAPECLGQPMSPSPSSDVWSLGVVMYEIFNCGEAPFTDEKDPEIVEKIKNCSMPAAPENTPEEIKKLLKAIWELDARKRPRTTKIGLKIHKLLLDMNFMEELDDLTPDMFSLNTIPGVVRKYPVYV